MTLGLALAALAALSTARAAPRASPLEDGGPPRASHRRGTADVTYTTATRAYLDAGTLEGLGAGEEITFRRSGEVVGRCTIDEAGDHNASCPAAGLRPGDDATFKAASTAATDAKPLPALVDEDDLARRAAQVAAAPPLPQVVFKETAPRQKGPSPFVAEAGVGAWAWTSSGPGRDQGAARVDVRIQDAPLGRWLTIDLDARAERWAPDAEGLGRGGATRLHVWQAQVNAPLRLATFSAGRLRSFGALGATVVDGVSASFDAGPARLGLFGGAVPAPDTLAPGSGRATAGGSWSLGKTFASGVQLATDGRVAWVRSPELGDRIEAALAARAWMKKVDLNAEAHLGVGGDVTAPGGLDLARLDVTFHPWQGFALGGGVRRQALAWPGALVEPSVFPGEGDWADGFVSLDLWRYLRLSAVGGAARDAGSELDRAWFGPELSMLRMFGNRLDLVLGYLEERGWAEGRSAYAQVGFRAGQAFRLVTRGSWSHDASFGLYRDEAGLSVSAQTALGRHLSLRLTALTRVPLQFSEEAMPPVGVAGSASIVASY